MTELSKLQIRAKVLSVISEIKSAKSFNSELLEKFTSDFEQIQNKEAVFDIFIKEYIKMQEDEYTFSACLLKNIVPSSYISEKAFEFLKSTSLSDDIKYKFVQLLRITGGECNFNEIPSYFENPEEVLDLETKKLLENAVFNPEAMLDFLDFVSAVSQNDRNILLQSLKQDYKGDVLANIIYPILYSDFDDNFVLKAVEILGDSKSSIAINPFNYLIKVSSNSEIVSACETGLKKLKLAGASIEKADEYFKNIVKDSIPAEFYTTIPDGNGNQALLISRENKKNKKFLLAAIVVNDIEGVIDCFGFFNISKDELIKVLSKFYQNDGKYKVPPEYVKSRIQEAVNLTVNLKKTFPYEFICWSPLINDIAPLNFEISDYISQNCKPALVTKNDILDILTKDYTLRWFITPNENHYIKDITDDYYSQDVFDIEIINSQLKEYSVKIFDEKTLDIWVNRIYNLIYLLRVNNKFNEADTFYTMLKNEDYFNSFKIILIQRSIFNYFIGLKEFSKESLLTTNIFKKRNTQTQKYDIKKIDKLISLLKKSWING